jgi:hypothetical protein
MIAVTTVIEIGIEHVKSVYPFDEVLLLLLH